MKTEKKVKALQQPYVEDNKETIGNLLFSEKETEENKVVVFDMWKKREKKRKALQMN